MTTPVPPLTVRDKLVNIALRQKFPSSIATSILDTYILIPRADLPEVIDNKVGEHVYPGAGPGMPRDGDPAAARGIALRYLAHAEWLEDHAPSPEEKRQARREELARELGDGTDWNGLLPSTRKAIDRIVEMEWK